MSSVNWSRLSNRVPRVVEIKKAYSFGIAKENLARGKSQTEEVQAYGEEYTMFGFHGSFFGLDRLSEALRGKVREMILSLAEAELSEILVSGIVL